MSTVRSIPKEATLEWRSLRSNRNTLMEFFEQLTNTMMTNISKMVAFREVANSVRFAFVHLCQPCQTFDSDFLEEAKQQWRKELMHQHKCSHSSSYNFLMWSNESISEDRCITRLNSPLTLAPYNFRLSGHCRSETGIHIPIPINFISCCLKYWSLR